MNEYWKPMARFTWTYLQSIVRLYGHGFRMTECVIHVLECTLYNSKFILYFVLVCHMTCMMFYSISGNP